MIPSYSAATWKSHFRQSLIAASCEGLAIAHEMHVAVRRSRQRHKARARHCGGLAPILERSSATAENSRQIVYIIPMHHFEECALPAEGERKAVCRGTLSEP